MFKRVLLCYDGSEVGRRALKRGAELAILVGAQVYVLSIIPNEVAGAAIVAGAAGHACLVDEAGGYRKLLDESIEWLKARGVSAEGYLASGNTIEQIIAFSRRLSIDLIVLGHYPQPSGGFWWGSPHRTSACRARQTAACSSPSMRRMRRPRTLPDAAPICAQRRWPSVQGRLGAGPSMGNAARQYENISHGFASLPYPILAGREPRTRLGNHRDGLGIGLLYFARGVLVPITLAIILSLLIAPLVRVLRRLGLGQTLSVLAAVLVLALVLRRGGRRHRLAIDAHGCRACPATNEPSNAS